MLQEEAMNTIPVLDQTRYGRTNLMTLEKPPRDDSPTMTPEGRRKVVPTDKIVPPSVFQNSSSETMASSKLFAPIKANAEPSWMADKRLTRSKVYMARFHKAAIVLQKNARRFLNRDGLKIERENQAAIKIQAIARGNHQRHLNVLSQQATKIQALARGWHTRRWHQVTVLEARLDQIQQQKKQDLASIELWKELQKKKILKEEIKALKKMNRQMRQLEKSHEVIAALRAENKRIRAENETLAARIQVLKHDNIALVKGLKQLQEHESVLKPRIQELERKIPQYVDVLKQLTERRTQYKKSVEEAKEFYVFEQKARHIFLDSISNVLQHIHDKCKDKELVDECTGFALAHTDA